MATDLPSYEEAVERVKASFFDTQGHPAEHEKYLRDNAAWFARKALDALDWRTVATLAGVVEAVRDYDANLVNWEDIQEVVRTACVALRIEPADAIRARAALDMPQQKSDTPTTERNEP